MPENSLLARVTELVTQQTINKKIPTLVLLSEELSKSDLLKNIVNNLCGNRNDIFSDSSSVPWQEISDIMLQLAEIPLLVKETANINDIRIEAESFIKELNKAKGLVIIDSDSFHVNQFTTDENISIIVLKS